jgi:hypothetical protein
MLAPSHYRKVGASESGNLVSSVRVLMGMNVLSSVKSGMHK